MASSIITVTENKPSDSNSIKCCLKSKPQDEPNVDKAHKIHDYYDEALPKNDSEFLKPIRKWEKKMGFVTPIIWSNLIMLFLFHVAFFVFPYAATKVYGLPKWQTVVFIFFAGTVGGFGVTGGAHRYWTHRSYKANLPLQILLSLCFSFAGQNTIPEWVRDHRVHHKMSETDADPHNIKRGFFFAHIGWLMMKKHPKVIREGKKMDMSDVLDDPLVKLHTKYFTILKMVLCFVLPTIIPVYLWGEALGIAASITFVRFILNLHFTFVVNSFAHLWGDKPYDPKIMPTDNWKVSFVALGEGWHNYHHTFPWDYKASEMSYSFNLTTFILDCFALLGWAYELKKASPSLIKAVTNSKSAKQHVK